MCHDVFHCKSLVDFGLATLKIVSQVRQILGSTDENNKASHGARQSQKKMMDPLFSLEEIRRSCYICLRACLHGGVGDPRLVR